MKINQVIHGFQVLRARRSEELGGTLYEMKHLKTGAELAWLDNREDNMLFSVAFKTLPWDDTGVFHILEHSVLAGSEHYPVKEPFLDLLKSSMNTFLNAMTFPDKTMYPVSSKNEQDFMNLTHVYLDAVFRPAIYHNESIFRQEGWHYELNESDEAYYNGVVYNEMKGVFSSVDGVIEYELNKLLYPDSVYGFESGGAPFAIPDLTYDSFLKAHKAFYSPSNARIYLDGKVPLERVLALINDEYLATLAPCDAAHPIALQKPVKSCDATRYYAIGKEEDAADKTQFVLGKVFATWEERKRIMAYSLLASFLAGSNEAPLKRAILEKGLAQDVEFSVLDGIAQPYYAIIFRNTDADKTEEIKRVYQQTLQGLIQNGPEREELQACFNQFEFSLREPEEPKGLTRNIQALNAWLYGGDMLQYMENNTLLTELRSALDGDDYLNILKELADMTGTVSLTMLPSKTKGDEDAATLAQRAKSDYASFGDTEKAAAKATFDKMRAWQDTPDAPAAKATLPTLSLSDVNPTPPWTDTQVKTVNGVKLLFHPLHTNGIVHCNLYFNAADETAEQLSSLAFLTELLGVLPTKKHTAAELQKQIKTVIGALDFSIETIADKDDATQCTPYFNVSFSVLEQHLEEATDLIVELLRETDFSQKDLIYENLLQCSESVYQAMMSAGHVYAFRRALSHSAGVYTVAEQTKGYALYSYLNDFSKHYEDRIAAFTAYAEARTQALFTGTRLTVSETAEAPHEAVACFAARFPQGETVPSAMRFAPAAVPKKEAILIPSGVSYAAFGANIRPYGFAYGGMLTVTSLLLTYGYLWNEIRVHGGAYGCGFKAMQNDSAFFYSYRDPAPLRSVEVYQHTADFIRQFVDGDEALENYIISSVAATEALMSTAAQGHTADVNYLSGYSFADKCNARTEMLSLQKADLLRLCDLFEKMKAGNSACIVGSAETLSSLDDSWHKYHI